MSAAANQWSQWRTADWSKGDWRATSQQATTTQRRVLGWDGYGGEYRAPRAWPTWQWGWEDPYHWQDKDGLRTGGDPIQPFPGSWIIANNANTDVLYHGDGAYYITKIGGSAATFDADAVSTAGATGDFVLRIHVLGDGTGLNLLVGVSAAPTADSNYTSIDRGIQLYADGSTYYYESSVRNFGGEFTFTGADPKYIFLRRVGSTLTVLNDAAGDISTATLQKTLTDLGGTLYFDSSFATIGNQIEVYFYKPMPILAADVGSYVLTGTATALTAQRNLTAAVGSYSVTGTTAGLKFGRNLVAEPGSYSLTGTAASLARTWQLIAAVGSYSITGTAAALQVGRALVFVVGSYSLTGTAAGLKKGFNLVAAPGSYAISGQTTSLTAQRRLAGDVGSYALSGVATGLLAARALAVDPGAYAYTGNSVGLTYGSGYELAVDPGAYAYTGTAVALSRGRTLVITPGAYVIDGQPSNRLLNAVAGATAGVRVTAAFFRV